MIEWLRKLVNDYNLSEVNGNDNCSNSSGVIIVYDHNDKKKS